MLFICVSLGSPEQQDWQAIHTENKSEKSQEPQSARSDDVSVHVRAGGGQSQGPSTRCPQHSLPVPLRPWEIRGAAVTGGATFSVYQFKCQSHPETHTHRKSRFIWAPHGRFEPRVKSTVVWSSIADARYIFFFNNSFEV